MKKLQLLSFMLVALLGLTVLSSCEDDDDDDNNDTNANVVSGSITSDVTWTADQIWTMDGRVIVEGGATLTIEPGTIIKAKAGTGSLASALIIAKDGMIDAQGSASNPIIFTSEVDNIQVGQKVGTNLDPETSRAFWGGVIILGDAPISPSSGSTAQIEGVPTSVAAGNYGGSNNAHDAGVFRYVSIRHGGALFGAGNEINGLTLGGVGNATTIDHVEVVANVDDGIEWFGGSVDCSDLIVLYQGDDAFDVDQSFAGTVSNIASIAADDSDHTFEIDGPEGSTNAGLAVNAMFMNGKFKGNEDSGEFADFRDGAAGSFASFFFFGYSGDADVELDDDAASANANNGDLTMTGWVIDTTGMGSPSLTDIAADKSSNPSGDFDTYFSTNNSIGTTGGGAFDKSQFTGWTMADQIGLLSDF